MTEMPHASSASLIPDHDDSGTYVNQKGEEDKDFAPPPKKLKGEEEDNTPTVVPMSQDSGEEDNSSVPKSQDSGEEEVPKSQDSPYIWTGYAVDSDLEEKEAPPYTEDEAREAFDLWRQMLEVEYADQSEYEKRFKFFKDSLSRKVSRYWKEFAINMLDLADRSPQEIRAAGDYCSISIKDIRDFYDEEFKPYL